MRPRSLAKLEKARGPLPVNDSNGFFEAQIAQRLAAADMKAFGSVRQDCLMARNTLAFDAAEFGFGKSLLEKKAERAWTEPSDIPDAEVVKYFEEDKKAAWRRLKKEEKTKKTREVEKLKEQERIVAEKEKKLRDEDQCRHG